MRGNARHILFPIYAILLGTAQPALGSEIFHWVDEDGVRHFSDWAPKDSSVEVTKVVLADTNPSGYDPASDPNSILDQAQRVNEIWQDIKAEKEERRDERLEQARQARSEPSVQYDGPGYSGFPYFFQRVRPPGFVPVRPFKTQKRQLIALDRLGLGGGPRPHSINSSAHLARVNASRSLQGEFVPQRVPSNRIVSPFRD